MANFFPRWTNWIPLKLVICGIIAVCGLTAATLNRGISCFRCHGPVNHMSTVYLAKPHSMAWCLDCHRHPENFLRPDDQVFNLDWKPDDVKPAEFVAKYGQPHDARDDFSKK